MVGSRFGRALAFLAAAAIGTTLLTRAAIANGYPLIYYDSGSYLAMSVQRWPHFERPVTYPLFLAATGWNRTLIAPVIAQGLVVFTMLYAVFRRVARLSSGAALAGAVVAAAILSFLTAASYTVSWLIPDVFTSVMILALATLLTGELSPAGLIGLGAAAVAAQIMHMSHLLIGLFLAGGALLVLLLLRKRHAPAVWAPSPTRLRQFCIVALAGWPTLIAINFAITHRVYLFDASNVFLTAKFAQNGILKSFLDEHPEGYALAAYRGRLPMPFEDFLWRDTGPLAALGGRQHCLPECNRLVHDILSRPKYLTRFAGSGLRDGAKTLFRFDVYSFRSYRDRPEVLPPLRRYYPGEVARFLAADQQNGQLTGGFARLNVSQRILAALATIALILVLVVPSARRAVGPGPTTFSVVVFLAVILNALVCGSLSELDRRFGSRVIWLLPLTTMVMGAAWLNALRIRRASQATS